MMMRVLMLTNMYPSDDDPSYGTFVEDQVNGLRARGVDVDVLYINGRVSRWNYVKGILDMRRAIGSVHYDIIHAHYVFSGYVARLQRQLPVVVNFHGEPFGSHAWLSKRLAPFIDGCIVTSKRHKASLGFKDARIVPCGVDLNLFKPMPQEEAKAQLGLPLDRKTITFIGAHRPEKRLDVIQAAVSIIKSRRDDVDLMLPTGLSHDLIPVYMNAADVLLLTSDYEGSPMVIKEAMACNLPIVSTAVGDVPEVIGGTEGCYLCEQNPEDVAAKVQLALEFGKRTDGRKAVEHLQTSCEIDKVLELYRDVLAKRRKL